MLTLTTSSLGLFYIFSFALQRREGMERPQGDGVQPQALSCAF